MKITESFLLLLLLVGSGSMLKSNEYFKSCPQDVYAALREMTALLTEQKVQIQLLHEENKGQAAELQKQQAEVLKLKEQLQVRQVAFSAALVPSGTVNLGPFPTHTMLIFKHVQTNIGRAYNKHTGVFTAPVRGAYHFEWHVGTHGDGRHASSAILIKNSENIFMAFEQQSAHFGTASNSVTLLLEVGDAVFLRLRPNAKVHDNFYHHNTFSGHLLFPV